MARVTVEDCLQNVDNRFQLVLVAAKRARQLTMGKEPMVDWENDKATVVALREISEGLVDQSILEEKPEEIQKEETLEDLLAAEQDTESGMAADSEQAAVAAALANPDSLFATPGEPNPEDAVAAAEAALAAGVMGTADAAPSVEDESPAADQPPAPGNEAADEEK